MQSLRRSANALGMKEDSKTIADNLQAVTADTPQATIVDPGELVAPAASVNALPPAVEPGETVATMVTAETLVEETKTLPPGKGKGNRTLDDYAKGLDWDKSNHELAKIAGVSRQRIAQIRMELKDREESEALAGTESKIGGLPPGFDTANEATPTTTQAATTPTASPVNYQLMAETVFAMSTGLATMMIGPEWQPRQLKGPNGEVIEEKAAVVEALRSYFESKQFQDLPPGYMLCFVVASYAAPRFAHENTRSKFKLTWLWCKTKIGGWFNRKKKFIPQIVNHATPATQANQP